MNENLSNMINMMKEVKKELENFNDKKEAIEFLTNNSHLNEKDCNEAYDFLMKMNLDNLD